MFISHTGMNASLGPHVSPGDHTRKIFRTPIRGQTRKTLLQRSKTFIRKQRLQQNLKRGGIAFKRRQKPKEVRKPTKWEDKQMRNWSRKIAIGSCLRWCKFFEGVGSVDWIKVQVEGAKLNPLLIALTSWNHCWWRHWKLQAKLHLSVKS